ncbi:DNA methyltransferase [Lentimicrobium sp. S6]|uniref:DNA methyltransferase n=1 Tax=Lentimicrobium sp. S6 TaxID=2735872 RepID=UPI0015543548|nr:DNA methyltransferase [Lentimicrobium sp. S6]NPD45117.1 DNA methylase [Lentimicrobium sp. S6]
MNTEKITVLGKTFNSEEERREYFRNELRKHLPELKKMEGFPIGEDEDIIKLSDPPYYTACPNPWLNDFIAEWEEEKKQLEKEGKRSADFVVDEPYASDVSEGKSNPIYTAHTYHTKVPHPAIMRYLLYYTQPGDSVLDAFGGTGMTGVAAQICENPDNETKYKIEQEWKTLFGSTPNWGKRKAICGDLSPYASFISYNYNTPADLDVVQKESQKILNEVLDECSWLYETKHIDNGLGMINYTVWSDVFNCHNCGHEIIFWDAAMNFDSKKVIDDFECPVCNSINNKKSSERVYETIYDKALEQTINRIKTVPVLIVYTYQNKRFQKTPDENDQKLIRKIENSGFNNKWVPTYRMPEGDESRRNDNSGITHIHHFYTKRNLIALSGLNHSIEISALPTKMKFLLTGMINRSTQMNRVHVKNFFYGGGGWNAGHLKGTFYIPSLPVETSILEQISDKIKSYLKAINLLSNEYTILQYVGSASKTGIEDSSIDYIFTDPPFGANIMYSELNFLPESWLRVLTNNQKEAIENKTQGKSLLVYQQLMIECFKENYRVLKHGKWMTVEFSNTKAAVWNGIQTALQRAGFIIANVAAIDKKQGGMRSITTATAVRQDLAISCYKPSKHFISTFNKAQNTNSAIWEFIMEHLEHLPIHLITGTSTSAIIERSPKILFDRLIAFYVQKGLPVPIDAGKFQQGLRERFIETDGMFFTSEQAAEYDKKKAEHPDFVQLSLLVASEQDGVLWLKNQLSEKAMTYQDIQPEWMQALSGLRKGDILPELKVLLEENFLKDEEGRWYQPDPENEADLEKLRTKRLLKQFEIYRAEAAKPKTKKIKEVRVEALRTGFKHCYQEKDFKTIVEIGNKIPENLLMEDEVLLQFYDIASNKI